MYHDRDDGEEDPVAMASMSAQCPLQLPCETHNNWGSRWIVCTTACAMLNDRYGEQREVMLLISCNEGRGDVESSFR